MKKIVLKILAAPAMCLLALAGAIGSLAVLVAGFVGWFLAIAAGVGGVALILTHHPAGGIAFLVIAFMVSPWGIPKLIAWLIGKLNGLKYLLKSFLFS